MYRLGQGPRPQAAMEQAEQGPKPRSEKYQEDDQLEQRQAAAAILPREGHEREKSMAIAR